MTEKLVRDYWQFKKCSFLELQAQDKRAEIVQLLPKELDRTAEIAFFNDRVEIQWNGIFKVLPKPLNFPKRVPYVRRSKHNPFMPCREGEE